MDIEKRLKELQEKHAACVQRFRALRAEIGRVNDEGARLEGAIAELQRLQAAAQAADEKEGEGLA
ncbi:MAG: hypothetical protein C4551_02540 [Bacillota bacterium]|nr:MAG: hypothetical protein C4551_02540 [Bacillota bacterium]